jgi:hypothetical protein
LLGEFDLRLRTSRRCGCLVERCLQLLDILPLAC